MGDRTDSRTKENSGGSGAEAPVSKTVQRLVEQLERLIGQTALPAMRVSLLLRLASTWEKRGRSPIRALTVLRRALLEKPDDPKVLREISRIVAGHPEVADDDVTLEDLAARIEEPAVRAPILVQLGRLVHATDPERALSLYREARALRPEDPVVLNALAPLLREAQQWGALAEVLEQLVDALPVGQERATLQLQRAELFAHRLQRPDAARDALEEARSVLGADERVLVPLISFYRDGHAWGPLADALEELAGVAGDAGGRLRREALRVASEQLHDEARAERLARNLIDSGDDDGEARAALLARFRKSGDSEQLYELLEQEYQEASSRNERARAAAELARLHEKRRESLGQAAEWYRKAVKERPEAVDVLEDWVRVLRTLERKEELSEALERLLEHAPAGRRVVEWWLELARIRDDLHGDRRGALAAVRAALEHAPGHTEALALYEQLVSVAGDEEDVIELLGRKANALEDPTARALSHVEQGRHLEATGRSDAAVEAYRAALAAAPGLEEALEPLVRILETRERDEELLPLYAAAIAATSAPLVLGRLYRKLGETQLRLGDESSATVALERSLRYAPSDALTLERLADLHLVHDRGGEALSLLARAAESDAEGIAQRDRLHLLERAAELAESLGRPGQAVELLLAVEELRPADGDLLLRFARLHRGLGQRREAMERLEQALREPVAPLTPDEQASIESSLAELALEDDDWESAERHAARLLERTPNHERALAVHAEVRLREGDPKAAVETLRKLVSLRERAGGREPSLLNTRLRIGDILAAQCRDLAGARKAYEEAVAGHPRSVPALEKLLQVLRELGDVEEGFEVLRRLARLAAGERQRAGYHVSAAQLLASQDGRSDEVVEHLVQAVRLDPAQTDPVELLEAYLGRVEDWPGLALALFRVAHAKRAGGAMAEAQLVLESLGACLLERLGDVDGAIAAFSEARDLAPSQRGPRLRLAQVLQSNEYLDEALEELRTLAALEPERPEAWRAMVHTFEGLKRPVGAYFALSGLVLTGGATPQEETALGDYAAKAQATAPAARKTPVAWRRAALAATVHMPVGQLMRLLQAQFGDVLDTPSLRDMGIQLADEIQPDQDVHLVRVLQTVTGVLGVDPPRIFFSSAQTDPLRFVPTAPPALACGPVMLKVGNETEKAFLLGKALACMLPETALGAVFPEKALQSLLQCVRIFAAGPDRSPPARPDDRAHAVVRLLERRLDPDEARHVRELVRRTIDSDVSAWQAAVAHSANRVGLVCCADLLTATRVATRPFLPYDPLTEREARIDLALFSVSEGFLELFDQEDVTRSTFASPTLRTVTEA